MFEFRKKTKGKKSFENKIENFKIKQKGPEQIERKSAKDITVELVMATNP